MTSPIDIFTKSMRQESLPDIRPGDTVRVHQKIKEGSKERLQVFEGVVLARKHGKGINATITVRKISSGVGVERIFPIHSPSLDKIEVVKRSKVRRAKLYYLRDTKGKKARLKTSEFGLEKEEVPVESADVAEPVDAQA
ncbi:MAG: 50S ribosomal protein L19 [Parcubacteria group bacterium]|nr:50S ribosomal protein L19 [Parcubacteria group bacterium]